MTMYTSDDYTYRYVYQTYATPDAVEINGIKSIVKSQINHYQAWNGRFVSHSIVQFFMQYNKVIFNIFNSIAFLLLGFTIYSVIRIESDVKNRNYLLLFIYLMLWLQIPEFGSSVLWLSGSINYLWMSLIYTFFILLNLRISKDSILNGAILGIIGFLSGATNENSGPATSLICFLLIFQNLFLKNGMHYGKVFGIASSIVGFYFMISSPGSQKRGHIDYSLDVIINNLISVYSKSLVLFLCAYLLISLLLFLARKNNTVRRNDIYFILIMTIGHFASIYSMVLSPEVPTRSMFGSSIFIIIITSYLFNKVYGTKFFTRMVLLTICVLSVSSYIYAFIDIRATYLEVLSQIDKIKSAEPNSDVNVVMISRPKSTFNAYYGTANISKNKNDWFNSWMSRYYGVRSITGTYK